MKLANWSLVATAGMFVLVGSCNNPADESPVPTEQEAYAALETALYGAFTTGVSSSADLERTGMAKVNELFRQRVVENPSDPTANFAAGLTEVFSSYADPDISLMIKDMEGAGGAPAGSRLFPFSLPKGTGDLRARSDHLAAGLATILSRAVTDPPSLARIQNVLKSKFIPRLEYALARFAVVEQHQGFEFRVSGKMQGDPSLSSVYLDLTEVYIMEAMVRMLKASVDQFLVYDFQLTEYSTKALVEALQPQNTTFFYLASDGAARAHGIKLNMLATFQALIHAVDFLAAETDNQSDDIIKLGPGGASAAALQQIRDGMMSAETMFTKPQTVRLIDADTDGNDYDVTVSLSAFFDNPPQNPKTQWLPPYTVDTTALGEIMWHWTQQEYSSFAFPDPTFGGVLPGMTSTNLKRIMHIDEAFGWRLDCSLNDQNGSLSGSTILKLDVNGTLYSTKYSRYTYTSPYYDSGWFLMTTGNGLPATLRVYQGATEIPLQFKAIPTVRLKNYDYVYADLTLASQSISGTAYAGNPPYIILNSSQWGSFVIERKTTGGFAAIDTTESAYQWYDYSVTSGTTYTYRMKMIPSRWMSGYAAVRAQNYTNEVVLSVP